MYAKRICVEDDDNTVSDVPTIPTTPTATIDKIPDTVLAMSLSYLRFAFCNIKHKALTDLKNGSWLGPPKVVETFMKEDRQTLQCLSLVSRRWKFYILKLVKPHLHICVKSISSSSDLAKCINQFNIVSNIQFYNGTIDDVMNYALHEENRNGVEYTPRLNPVLEISVEDGLLLNEVHYYDCIIRIFQHLRNITILQKNTTDYTQHIYGFEKFVSNDNKTFTEIVTTLNHRKIIACMKCLLGCISAYPCAAGKECQVTLTNICYSCSTHNDYLCSKCVTFIHDDCKSQCYFLPKSSIQRKYDDDDDDDESDTDYVNHKDDIWCSNCWLHHCRKLQEFLPNNIA
jgi:hypothetical protein